MHTALHMKTRVLPGHRIEITAPELIEGEDLEVFLVRCEAQPTNRQPMLDLLESLPPRPLLFKTPEEADRYIQEERDSWER